MAEKTRSVVRKIIRRLSVFLLGFALIFPSHFVFAEEILAWKDCVLEARKNHPDLVSAREKLNQSTAGKMQTVSGLLPQVSGSVDAARTKTTLISDNYSYGISGKQLLFDGFKTYFDVQAAEKNIDASRYNYEVTSSNVRLRLRAAFTGLLKAQELLKITQNISKRRKQSRDMVKLRYDAGGEHRGSFLTAEANLAQAEFETEQARRGVALAQRRLSKELGRTKLVPISATGDFDVADKTSAQPDFESLSESTPLLRELIVQKEAARWGVQSAVASFFPTVFANGSADRTASGWPPTRREWSGSISLSVPLFEGGNLIAGASKAEAAFHQSQADEKSGRDGVILALEDTWTQFQDALSQVIVQQKFLAADQERAKIAEAQYTTGLITFNDWIIIEDNLVSVEKSCLTAEANALLTEAAWLQAKGETLDAA